MPVPEQGGFGQPQPFQPQPPPGGAPGGAPGGFQPPGMGIPGGSNVNPQLMAALQQMMQGMGQPSLADSMQQRMFGGGGGGGQDAFRVQALMKLMQGAPGAPGGSLPPGFGGAPPGAGLPFGMAGVVPGMPGGPSGSPQFGQGNAYQLGQMGMGQQNPALSQFLAQMGAARPPGSMPPVPGPAPGAPSGVMPMVGQQR